tara:strand:- start:218 stop:775 length:558 start_codon:yes stop_codon:yes gene_type:complete
MNIDNFTSQLTGGGVRPHLFEVDGSIGGVSPEGTKFLIKAAQLPASTVGVIEVPYKGRKIKIPGDRTFAEWTITVISDGKFELRNAFEKWMSKINSHEGNISNPNDHSPGRAGGLYQDWTIRQFDRKGETIHAYKMVNCFPTEVSAMEVSYETTDTIHEFTVSLQYTYWTATDGTTDGIPPVRKG